MARGMPETLVILPLPERVTSDRAPKTRPDQALRLATNRR